MATFNDVARVRDTPASDPASRPELARLEAQRRTPAPLRALVPPGMQQTGSTRDDRQREERIRQIEATLEQARGTAVDDFSLGAVRGKAKRDHGQSR